MTKDVETPPSTMVHALAWRLHQDGHALWASTHLRADALDHIAADLDAQERLMAEMIAVLRAHDAYMLDIGHCGPESPELNPKAAENWRRVRTVLARINGKPRDEKA